MMTLSGDDRRTYGLLFLILMAGVLIRILVINSSTLEFDEGYSLWFAAMSYQELLNTAPKIGIHPVLYYILLKSWILVVGDGDQAIRGLSLIFNVLTIPLIFIIGKNLAKENQANLVGLLAALFFAISPLQMTWPMMARPYAMMIMSAAITCAGFSWYIRHGSEANKNPNSGTQILADIAIVLGSALVLWSHNMSTLFIAALIVFLIWWVVIDKTCSYKVALRIICLWIVSLILWAPHAYTALHQALIVTSNLFPSNANNSIYIYFIDNIVNVLSIKFFLRTPSSILFIILCYIGIKYIRNSISKDRAYFLLSLIIMPFIFEIFIGVLLKPLITYKTHIWASIPVLIAISQAIISLSSQHLRYTLIIIITISSVIGCYFSDMSQQGRADLWPSIAEITRGGDEAKIPVIFYPNDHEVMYYREISRLPNFEESLYNNIVPVPGPFPQLDLDRPTMAGVAIVLKEDVLPVLNTIGNPYEFWIIRDTASFFDPKYAFRNEIEKTYELIDSKIWGGKYRKIQN